MEPHLRAHFQAVGKSTPPRSTQFENWKDAVDEVNQMVELQPDSSMFEHSQLALQPSTQFGKVVELFRLHVRHIQRRRMRYAWRTWQVCAHSMWTRNLTRQMHLARHHSALMLLNRFVVPLRRKRREAFMQWHNLTLEYMVINSLDLRMHVPLALLRCHNVFFAISKSTCIFPRTLIHLEHAAIYAICRKNHSPNIISEADAPDIEVVATLEIFLLQSTRAYPSDCADAILGGGLHMAHLVGVRKSNGRSGHAVASTARGIAACGAHDG